VTTPPLFSACSDFLGLWEGRPSLDFFRSFKTLVNSYLHGYFFKEGPRFSGAIHLGSSFFAGTESEKPFREAAGMDTFPEGTTG